MMLHNPIPDQTQKFGTQIFFLQTVLSSEIGASCILSSKSRKGQAMDRERFVSDRNIERYWRLACAAIVGTDRMRLLGLLADEEDRYTELQKARPIHAWSPPTCASGS